MRHPLVLLLAAALACAPAPTPDLVAPPVASPAPPADSAQAVASARPLPRDVHWVRAAAEYRAIFEQVYTSAEQELERLATGLGAGSWAVILDADETILDNSEYQRRRAVLDSGFTPESWTAWVRERRAAALPGAGEFVSRVRALGGRVAIVTNRSMAECDDTRANLAAVGAPADLLLCKQDGPGEKNARFAAVQGGSAEPGVPPLRVLMWVGDNIHDFPALTQAVRDSAATTFAPFGRSWFILPNPMYGSWERNSQR